MSTPKPLKRTINGIPMLVNSNLADFTLYDKKSSMITYIGVQAEPPALFIQFTKGDCVLFNDIPQEAIDQALEATSIGKFYHAELKGQYEAQKVTSNAIVLDEGEEDDDDAAFGEALEESDDDLLDW